MNAHALTHRTGHVQPMHPGHFKHLDDDALLRVAQFTGGALLPLSRATWYRLVKAGKAPKPVRPSPGVAAWPVGSLRAWMRAQANTTTPADAV